MSNKIVGELADFAVHALEAHKPEALALIKTAEGGIEGAIVNSIKNLPKPGGIYGMVFPTVEVELTSFVTGLVAKYGEEVVFDFIDLEAHAFAKSLGG